MTIGSPGGAVDAPEVEVVAVLAGREQDRVARFGGGHRPVEPGRVADPVGLPARSGPAARRRTTVTRGAMANSCNGFRSD